MHILQKDAIIIIKQCVLKKVEKGSIIRKKMKFFWFMISENIKYNFNGRNAFKTESEGDYDEQYQCRRCFANNK